MAYAALAEDKKELYHPKTFIGKYIWSQDHKVIALQYSVTAIMVGVLALVLSGFMRMQIGFPGLSIIEPATYYQFVTMHGMIMVIYLLTALLLGGFGNYLIPLMIGARDMVFPYVNMLSYWVYLVSVLVLVASFFVPGFQNDVSMRTCNNAVTQIKSNLNVRPLFSPALWSPSVTYLSSPHASALIHASIPVQSTCLLACRIDFSFRRDLSQDQKADARR